MIYQLAPFSVTLNDPVYKVTPILTLNVSLTVQVRHIFRPTVDTNDNLHTPYSSV